MASKGIPGLDAPRTTTEFHAMVELYRSNVFAVYDQLNTINAELHKGLKNAKGSGLEGAQRRLAIRKVMRQMRGCAGNLLASAQRMNRAYQIYLQYFVGAADKSGSTNGIQVNK
jgi:hypothetical protein